MSWNLEKGNRFLSGLSLHRLQTLYKNEKNAKAKLRLLAAIHRKQGKSIDAIVDLLGVARRTVHGWLWRFQERGVKGKDDRKQSGKIPKLTKTQMKRLVKDLEQGPKHNKNGLWSTKEVQELLKKKYGVSFVSQHVWRILKSLGFSLQRPRKRHYKCASPDEIKEFKKKQKGKQDIIARKDLLWARKMKQHSV